jgi:hypothetical protein
LPLNWSTTDKESAQHGIKVLVYGRAGTGKTTLCGTAPTPVIISAEAGLLSLRSKKIPVLVVSTMQDVWDAFTWCQTKAKAAGIQTICLDSISEIGEKVLAVQKKKKNDPRQAYGDMATEMIDLVKSFRDLAGFHVVVTAKEITKTDPITNVNRAEPTAPGQQVGPALPYLFDEVFHAFTGQDNTGKTYHALRTRASFNADAKDRSGALDEIEYPDIANIIHKIRSTQTS